jgi:hypothetical protein
MRSFDFAYATQAASFTNALALSVTVSRAAPGDRNWNSLAALDFWSWQRGHPRLSDVGVLRRPGTANRLHLFGSFGRAKL